MEEICDSIQSQASRYCRLALCGSRSSGDILRRVTGPAIGCGEGELRSGLDADDAHSSAALEETSLTSESTACSGAAISHVCASIASLLSSESEKRAVSSFSTKLSTTAGGGPFGGGGLGRAGWADAGGATGVGFGRNIAGRGGFQGLKRGSATSIGDGPHTGLLVTIAFIQDDATPFDRWKVSCKWSRIDSRPSESSQ